MPYLQNLKNLLDQTPLLVILVGGVAGCLITWFLIRLLQQLAAKAAQQERARRIDEALSKWN